VETSAWPLLYFFAALAVGGILVLVVMVFAAGGARWKRPVSAVAAVALVAALLGTFQAMSTSSDAYTRTESARYSQYVADVQTWLSEDNITADETTVTSLLTRESENVINDGKVVPIRFDYDYINNEIDIVHLSAPVIGG
jgi:hypothetical protein